MQDNVHFDKMLFRLLPAFGSREAGRDLDFLSGQEFASWIDIRVQ